MMSCSRYCPPEHIERSFFSDKFDIFSLGVVMIEIIAGPEGYCKAVEMTSQEFIDQVSYFPYIIIPGYIYKPRAVVVCYA